MEPFFKKIRFRIGQNSIMTVIFPDCLIYNNDTLFIICYDSQVTGWGPENVRSMPHPTLYFPINKAGRKQIGLK